MVPAMFLIEDIKFRRLQHMDRYDQLLRKQFNRRLETGIGSNNFVTDQPTKISRTKIHPTLLPKPEDEYITGRPSPHDLQYLAHSDKDGLHVYNPSTKSIESFPQHKFDRGFYDLPDDVKAKIPPLRREESRERHADMVKNNTPKRDSLLDEHVAAIEDYTSGSKGVNNFYLQPTPEEASYKRDSSPKLDMTDKDLHDLIDTHAKPLHRDLSVYSGTQFWNPVKDLKPGDTTHTKAWTSSSLNVPSAYDFTDQHMLHFKLPKGYNKGMYIAPYSSQGPTEREFLMKPNQKWRYSGSRKMSPRVDTTNNATVHTFEPVEE